MAAKKNKSKPDVDEAPDLATGWKKNTMTEAAVQELEDMKMLQNRAVIQCVVLRGRTVHTKVLSRPLSSATL